MTIKLYVDDILQEEYTDDGLVVLVRSKKMSMINLFSAEDVVLPWSEKHFLLPNGAEYTIRISTSPALREACRIMKQFKGLRFLELCDGKARLLIDY